MAQGAKSPVYAAALVALIALASSQAQGQERVQAPLWVDIGQCTSVPTELFVALLSLDMEVRAWTPVIDASPLERAQVKCSAHTVVVTIQGPGRPDFTRTFSLPSLSDRGRARLIALTVSESYQDWRAERASPRAQLPPPAPSKPPAPLELEPPSYMALDVTSGVPLEALPGNPPLTAGVRLSHKLSSYGGYVLCGEYGFGSESTVYGEVQAQRVAMSAAYLYALRWGSFFTEARTGWRAAWLRFAAQSTQQGVEAQSFSLPTTGPVAGMNVGWNLSPVRVSLGFQLGWSLMGVKAKVLQEDEFESNNAWGQGELGVGFFF